MTKFSAPQQNQLAQIGAFLRDNREKQSKSLEDIAIRTYIRPQLLNGIETGDPEMLPEPIFVQGFIRRYGEALGLNGVELSQQFTVTSIPSTPRPARQAPPSDSPTTRLTRGVANGSPATPARAAAKSTTSSPMFSAGATAVPLQERIAQPSQPSQAAVASSPAINAPVTNTPDDLTLGRSESTPVAEPAAFAANQDFDAAISDIASPPPSQDVTTTVNSFDGSAEPSTSSADVEEDFASKIAAFDQANLNSSGADTFDSIPTNFSSASAEESAPAETALPERAEPTLSADTTFGTESPTLSANTALSEPPAEPTLGSFDSTMSVSESTDSSALNSQATLNDNMLSNNNFDDGLPTAFTTQSDSVNLAASSATTSPAEPPEPVGVEYDNYDQPNLKPFIIGGVVAAIATGAIILASLLGGGDRQPSVVADSTDSSEQVVEGSPEALPTIPEEPVLPEPAEPAASSAPVYVEATATSEAWVSIIADGNPTPIFEGTLQPDDSQVWEAQETISVYSGDAGALELSANGGEAEVMGERGQPEEKIFPE